MKKYQNENGYIRRWALDEKESEQSDSFIQK